MSMQTQESTSLKADMECILLRSPSKSTSLCVCMCVCVSQPDTPGADQCVCASPPDTQESILSLRPQTKLTFFLAPMQVYLTVFHVSKAFSEKQANCYKESPSWSFIFVCFAGVTLKTQLSTGPRRWTFKESSQHMPQLWSRVGLLLLYSKWI